MRNNKQLHIACEDCKNHYICKYQEVIAMVSSIAVSMDFHCKYFAGEEKIPEVSKDNDGDIHSLTHEGTCHICGKKTEVVTCSNCGKDVCLKHCEAEDSLDISSSDMPVMDYSTQFTCNSCVDN